MVRIKRNPYTTVHVANLHTATPGMLGLLRQAVSKGFMEWQDQRVDLRHAIFIMSGHFTLPSENTLRFFESQTYQKLLEKQLGEEFVEVFDEIFCFQPLNDSEKLAVLRQSTQNWRRAPEERAMSDALKEAPTLEQALKKLRLGVTHS